MQIRELWQELDDEQAEKLSGGLAIQKLQVYSSRVRLGYFTVQAEGKIRGTLLF